MAPTVQMTLSRQLGDLAKITGDLKNQVPRPKDARTGTLAPSPLADGLTQLQATLNRLQNSASAQEAELTRLRSLAETAGMVNSSLDLTTVLNQVMDNIIRLTSAERGFLMLKDVQGELQFTVARGMDSSGLDKSDFHVSRTILNTVAQTGEPVVTTNAQSDPRFSAQESVIGYNLRSIVCVPLKAKGVITGVIYVDNRIRAGLFTDKERNLLADFANQAGLAIENARQFQQVTELKNLLDNVFASIASGVITTDTQDVITLCNHAAEHILGASAASLQGKPLHVALPNLGDNFNTMMQQVRAAQRPASQEFRPVLPNRGPVNWNLNMALLKNGGQGSAGLAIVLDDMTEKRRLQGKFEVFKRMVPPAVVERLNVDNLALGGVRREVSIVFTDIQGFTSLSETIDPEVLIRVLNQYIGTAAEAMLLQEATVDKFIGDAVMAFFNAPDDQPDHTLRAIRAALQMRRDVQSLHDVMEPQFRLNFRIAVHVGEAVVGLVGTQDRLDYTIIGDTVNTAKRIQENGIAGRVVISEATYDKVKDKVVVAPLEPMRLKGKIQPIMVYELLDLR